MCSVYELFWGVNMKQEVRQKVLPLTKHPVMNRPLRPVKPVSPVVFKCMYSFRMPHFP
jgi:hypothetical protein